MRSFLVLSQSDFFGLCHRAVVRGGATGAIAPVDFQKGSIAPVNFKEEVNHKTDKRELETVLKIGRCNGASAYLKIHGCNWASQASRLGVDEKGYLHPWIEIPNDSPA